MTTIVNDPVSTDPSDDPRLAAVLAPGEVVVAHATGMADAEPWRRVQVHVTAQRIVWLDETSQTVVSATHDAIGRASFSSFEAPPWPTYFEVDIDRLAGELVVAGADGTSRTVEGAARPGMVHRHVDVVRLRNEDACRLELAVREARDRR